MRKAFEIGGIVAAVVLVGFGVASIVMGASGGNTVSDNLAEQKIVGTPDMTPAAITAEGRRLTSTRARSRSRAARWPARR